MPVLVPQDLLIILGSATFVAIIFHALKLPTVMAFLATGILIGPHSLGLISSTPNAQLMTEICAILLLFTIGLEFSFARLKQLRRPFFGLGFPQVGVTILVSAAIVAYVFKFAPNKAIFIGFMVALSSTATVIKLLTDSRDLGSPYADSTLGVLIFQDLAVIPMILALPLLAGVENFQFSAQTFVTKVLVSIVGLWVGSRYIIPVVLHRVAQTRSRELFFFCIIFFCFGAAFLFEQLGFSLSLGAFLAGILISESPYGKQATSDLMPLRDNFLGIFFVSIGMLLDVSFVQQNIATLAMIIPAVIILKVLIIYLLGRLIRKTHQSALFTGLILFQLGEFSFILANSGLQLGLLSNVELQYFLSTAIVTLALTPLFYKLAPTLAYKEFYQALIPKKLRAQTKAKTDTRPDAPAPVNTKTIIIGYGISGQNLATALKALNIPYCIIDTNPQTVKKFSRLGDKIYFGDASRMEILDQAGIESARLVVITVAGSKWIDPIVRSIHKVRPDLRVLIRIEYLRDAKTFKERENVDLVVGEFETGIELLTRALGHYGVESEQIHSFVQSSRKKLAESEGALAHSLRRHLELPTWEALNALQPVVVHAGEFAVGKTILDLDLRRKTGANIVVIYREGFGSQMPNPDFTIAKEDVVYLIGKPESLEQGAAHLKQGPGEQ